MFNVKQTINNVQFINTNQIPTAKFQTNSKRSDGYVVLLCVYFLYPSDRSKYQVPNTKTRNLKLETKNNEHLIPKTSNQKL